jgi:hypothetical protein
MQLTEQQNQIVASRIPGLLAEWREKDARIHGIGIGIRGSGDSAEPIVAFFANVPGREQIQIPPTVTFSGHGESIDIDTKLVAVSAPMFAYCTDERPAFGGNCIASLGGGQVGTLGGVVVDPDKHHYVVSAAHVLTAKGQLKVGTKVLQPNDASRVIGTLTHLGPRWPVQGGSMKADAALAQVAAADVSYDIFKIGTIAGTVTPQIGMAVKVRGAATDKVQDEKVTYIYVSETVDSIYTFSNVVATTLISRQGDSGALAIEADSLRVAALLFAHSDKLTYYASVDDVIDVLKIKGWNWGKP